MAKPGKWGVMRAQVYEYVLNEFKEHNTVPSSMIVAEHFGIAGSSVKRYIKELREDGKIPPVGAAPIRRLAYVHKSPKRDKARISKERSPEKGGDVAAMLVVDPTTGEVGLFEGIMKSLGKIADLRNWDRMQEIKGLSVVGVIRDNGVLSGKAKKAAK